MPHQPSARVARGRSRLDEALDRSQHGVLIEALVAHIRIGPRQDLQAAGLNHVLLVYAAVREPLQVLFSILRFHDVDGLVATIEAVFEERAKDSVLLVEGVEEGANMTMTPQGASGERH